MSYQVTVCRQCESPSIRRRVRARTRATHYAWVKCTPRFAVNAAAKAQLQRIKCRINQSLSMARIAV